MKIKSKTFTNLHQIDYSGIMDFQEVLELWIFKRFLSYGFSRGS
jgi:hypothetical protein